MSGILSSIHVGSVIQLSCSTGDVVPVTFAEQTVLSVAQQSGSAFTVTTYAYNGENEAKATLEQSGRIWSHAEGELQGMERPVLLQGPPASEEFLFRDDGTGSISISPCYGEDDPFVRVVPASGGLPAYLGCGASDPGSDRFTIQIVS